MDKEMESFAITAPGRIVLCGGDGAMYGKHVVLASLNRHTMLEFAELPAGQRTIIIDFPDINLTNLEISLIEINNFRSSEPLSTLISDHIRFPHLLQSFIVKFGLWRTYEQSFSLQIFFFLLMYIATYEKLDIKPFRVKVLTELLSCPNLGSSSSFAACVSACFLYWARLQRDTNYVYNEEDLNKISQYAKLAEKVLQIDAMETDVDVCCHGKIIKFKYDTEKDEYSFDKLDAPAIKILLVNFNNGSKKGERRKQIAEKRYNRSVVYLEESLNTMNDLSIEIYETLVKISGFHISGLQQDGNEEFEKLKEKIKEYRRQLFELGLFDDKFEAVCANTELGKYVGMIAGYEDNPAYVLLLPTINREEIKDIQECFETRYGFSVIEAVVSCSGLIITNFNHTH